MTILDARGGSIRTTMLISILALSLVAYAPAQAQGNLQIVVIAGENAVNIIQQKTAVTPIVEVRDRNGIPVAGAVVTFSIQGGSVASFPGAAATMTVVTNAAGQAAPPYSPSAPDRFRFRSMPCFKGRPQSAPSHNPMS